MQDRSGTDHAHPAESARPRFGRALFGYRRSDVDEWVAQQQQQGHGLESQVVELRQELLDARHEAAESRHDLTRARAELRYWNDRASYVDSEVARARHRATELEQAARARADAIEAEAQERSLQLVDRVCTEANAMLQAAREEAREMFRRFETDVDMSQQKLEQLERVRTEVARTMQGALHQFEGAVRELDKVGPVRRIVESLEEPVRRSNPTFGQQKALEAARRFDEATAHGATAALSTPLDGVNEAGSKEPASSDEPTPPTEEPAPSAEAEAETDPSEAQGDDGAADGASPRQQHPADAEFASLVLSQQP